MKMRVGKNPYLDLGCAMFFNILLFTGSINLLAWIIGYAIIVGLRLYNRFRGKRYV